MRCDFFLHVIRSAHLFSVLSIAALLLIACSMRLSAAQEGIPSPVVPDGFGVNIHLTHFPTAELQKFKDAGFGFVRMDLGWNGIEKTKGVYDFSAFDTLLADLDKADARAILIFDYSNDLYDGGLSPYTDAGRAAFAAYAAAAAKHFANRGVIWEIYNEPNIGFWRPKPSVDAYISLVKATVAAVRKADPNATIMAGATSAFPMDYISALFASGAMSNVNALSVHPYRGSSPETAALDFARVRAVIARFTPPGKAPLPIVCSEWGYSTATNGVSEQKQAEYVLREYLANLAAGVNLTIYYDWKNDGPDPANNEHRFGVQQQDLTPKPAFLAVQGLVQALRGYTFRHRLAAASPTDYELLFEGPKDVALVDWSTDPAADPAKQLPAVTKVAPGDPRYVTLKHAAAIRFTPDVRVAITKDDVAATVQVANPDNAPATVLLSNLANTKKLALRPGETKTAFTQLAVGADGPSTQPIDLKITWNGDPLTVISPLDVERTSLLDVTVAPIGNDLSVTLNNPLSSAFKGKVTLTTGPNEKGIAHSVSIASAAEATVAFPGATATQSKLEAVDDSGLIWARQTTSAFIPVAGWSPLAPPSDQYHVVPYVENSPTPAKSIEVVPSPPGGPGGNSLAVSYDTGPGWLYSTVTPIATDPIPADVSAIAIWIYGDATGASLRNRFVDSTGQTFQVDGTNMSWNGWKEVTFPLDGTGASHWGGANDGVLHGPLLWQALVLIDGSKLPAHAGQILLAAPSYALK
jgi:hypothetical protein